MIGSGTTIGRYIIIDRLGAGGMGEVYRARDDSLQRDVAIKILPSSRTSSPEHVERFAREARSASALNHPGIITIYEIGTSTDGETRTHFIAMELVEGETLRQKIREGADPIEMIDHLVAVARALAKAHSAGIVHRDLKPENIMITSDGFSKILDFGLAKLTGPADVDTSEETIQREQSLTREGTIVGTAAYMSPEQIRGDRDIDFRADIFAFGCILHEVISGDVPFRGNSFMETAAKILQEPTPPIDVVGLLSAGGVERVVRRCLEKKRENRYASTQELVSDLSAAREEWSFSQHPAVVDRSITSRRSPALLISAVALLIMIGAFIGFLLVSRNGRGPTTPESMTTVQREIRRIPSTSDVYDLALSADGDYLAMAASDGDAETLRLRQLQTGRELELLRTENDLRDLQFTSDPNFIYYTSGHELFRIPLLGGDPQRIVSDTGHFTAVSPDGSRVVTSHDSMLWLIDSATGRKDAILEGADSRSPWNPVWSPDGSAIAFLQREVDRNIRFVPHTMNLPEDGTSQPSARPVSDQRWWAASALRWAPDGESLFLIADDLTNTNPAQIWRIGLADGAVQPVTEDLFFYSNLSVSRDGAISSLQIDARWQLAEVPLDGSPAPRQTATGTGPMRWTAVLPDGRLLYASDIDGDHEIMISERNGRNARALTNDPATDYLPAGSPDGETIAFVSDRNGSSNIWVMDHDGSGQRQLTDSEWNMRPQFSADGAWIFFNSRRDGESWLMRVPVTGGDPEVVSRECISAAISLQGRIACKQRDGWNLVTLDQHHAIERRFDVSIPNTMAWLPDGNGLVFTSGDAIFLQPLDGELKTVAEIPGAEWLQCNSLQDTLLCSYATSSSSAVLITERR